MRCRAPVMRCSSRCRVGPIRSSCSSARRRRACRSWCRFGTGGCWSRRSRSIAGRRPIMANDLGATPRSGLTVQCCGDAHLSNFGVFASPERRLVFDVNDFDETLPGPWEWDVKRLAASMLIAARDNGFRAKHQERIVLDTVGRYRTAMASFAGMTNLDVWYAHLDTENALKQYGSQFKSKVVKRTKKDAREGSHEGQHGGVLEAHSRRRRAAADHRRAAADRADRAALTGRGPRRAVRASARAAARLPRDARVRPARAARAVRA